MKMTESLTVFRVGTTGCGERIEEFILIVKRTIETLLEFISANNT